MKHFIKTSDEQTAQLLRDAGLQELDKDGSLWVFINEPTKIDFSSNDMKNVHSTNILHI